MLFFEAGLAVDEMPQSKLEVLHDNSLKEYEASLDNFNPLSEENKSMFSGISFASTIRESLVDELKTDISSKKLTGKKIWTGYNYIKSELINHWLPHLDIKVENHWVMHWRELECTRGLLGITGI